MEEFVNAIVSIEMDKLDIRSTRRQNWHDKITIASIDATDLATLCANLGVTL